MKKIILIECPSNLGLKRPAPDREPGVKKLPDHLRMLGLHRLLQVQKTLRLDPPDYEDSIDILYGVRNANRIAAYAMGQALLLRQALDKGGFPVVLGGQEFSESLQQHVEAVHFGKASAANAAAAAQADAIAILDKARK